MFSTTSYTDYAATMPRATSTANTNATFNMPMPNVNDTQRRRLFTSLAGPISDDAEDLLHPALYPVPAISKHGRERQASYDLRQQQGFPAAALASAISRKMPTLAQMVSADAEDLEDTKALFALIARTSATRSNPVRVPEFSFDAFNGTSTPDDVSLPRSRGSSFSSAASSSSSFECESDAEFGFEDDEEFDDAASVSSISSVESCFDFLASTKPHSQTRAQSPLAAIHTTAPVASPAPPITSAALFVPPQVRTHMNMLRLSRARAHSTVSNDSTSSGASSAGSWRSSASSASSRTSISSVSPTLSQKAVSVSTPASVPAPAANAAKTKYLYQGGVSTVLGGGVMLGGASAKPHQNQRTQKAAPRATTSTYSVSATTANTTATAPSWRRGAPSASMFSRA